MGMISWRSGRFRTSLLTLLSCPEASIFMLDISALNFSCFGFQPAWSYIASVLFWPGAPLQFPVVPLFLI